MGALVESSRPKRKGNHRDINDIRIGPRLCEDVDGREADVPRAVFHVREGGGDVGGVGVELRPLWRMEKPLIFGVHGRVGVTGALRQDDILLEGDVVAVRGKVLLGRHAHRGVESCDDAAMRRRPGRRELNRHSRLHDTVTYTTLKTLPKPL